MTHYHVGSNVPGYEPTGEVLAAPTLQAARDMLLASIASDQAGYLSDNPARPVTIKWDDDPDLPTHGVSAWLTIGDDEFSRYYWAGRTDAEAGESCDCDEGEYEVALARRPAPDFGPGEVEFDSRDYHAQRRLVTGGEWEVSYGEIWSNGDLAIMSTAGRVIARLVDHADEADEVDVANAELLVRAPKLVDLAARLAVVDPHAEPEEFDTLQADAVALLRDLTAGWLGR